MRSTAALLVLAAAMVTAALARAETIVSCGFEPSGDTWTYTADGGALNADPGAGDSPAGERIRSGSQSWLVAGTTSTLKFSEVYLAGWTNVKVVYYVSSTAASGGGNDPFDSVSGYLATTSYDNQQVPAFGGTPSATLAGSSGGAAWGYDAAKARVSIDVAGGKRSMALKLYATNDSAKKRWNLDDISLEGVPTISRDVWWAGGGNWNNAAGNPCWTPSGGAASAWNAARGDNACFGIAGATTTVGAGALVAARSLTFAADGCTIVAGDSTSKLALVNGGSGGAGAATVNVLDAAHAATINVPIVGNPGVGLTKTGAGTLALGAANAFTGTASVQEGTLRLTSAAALAGCSVIDIAAGASLDLAALPGGWRLGESRPQTLTGAGRVLGNLSIAALGVHDLGHSPGVQRVEGDYTMNGLLEIEISGAAPGDGAVGYDQLLVAGDTARNVSLAGRLALVWSDCGWSSDADRLWIVRNETSGALAGTFLGFANGAVVGRHDGRDWQIFYGADAATGRLAGGNDVLLTPVRTVPEPGAFWLAVVGSAALGWASRRYGVIPTYSSRSA